MISPSKEQLQQQLEYTLLKPDCHSRWISKMQSGRENTLEERYAIVFCFKLAPCDFWLFAKLRGCHYDTIEEMKEVVTKVIDMLTQVDFHGAFQKVLERFNKWLLRKRVEFHVCTLVVYWPPTPPNMPFQRRRKCIYHWRWRAWLRIWDKVKVPQYSHRLMHRKRVTCELHDSYFRSMTIKHAIRKTAEVTHSDGQLWGDIEWAI